MSTSLRSISNNQNTKECGKYYWCWPLLESVSLLGSDALTILQRSAKSLNKLSLKSSLTKLAILLIALAGRAVVVLKVIISTRKVNGRLLAGLVLVGIVTPIADVFYTFLPHSRVPESEWYYESWYWLFLCIGPYIAWISFLVGVSVLLWGKLGKLIYCFIPAIAFPLTKVIWLIQVKDHAEYLQVPPIAYYGWVAGSLTLLVYVSEYFAWRMYHRHDAHVARMDGLCQIANMSDPIQAGFVNTWKEMKAKNY